MAIIDLTEDSEIRTNGFRLRLSGSISLGPAEADARALWAVRVLDAWLETLDGTWRCGRWAANGEHGWRCELLYWKPNKTRSKTFKGSDVHAARLAAAEAVFPTLPADVRAKLGEKP